MLDDPAAPALKVLIARDQLTWEQRVAWTRFLIAALARSPDMIRKIQNEGRRHMEEALLLDPHEYEAVRSEGAPPTLLELAEQTCKPRLDNAGKLVLPDVIQHPKFAEAILRMQWATLDISTATHELLTSDRLLGHDVGWTTRVASSRFRCTRDLHSSQRAIRKWRVAF